MMDLLALIHYGEISLAKAERIFDETIEAVHQGVSLPAWWDRLGLSPYEATAHAQGAGLETLVRLRYSGWPSRCCRCHVPLDYRLFGWWIERGDDGAPCIRHIEYPVTRGQV